MKEMILTLLREHHDNCGDNRGRNDGEFLSIAVDNIIDLVKNLPNDEEIQRLRAAAVELSWVRHPEGMGR